MRGEARFGAGFVEEYRRRHGGRSPAERRLTYDIAVEAEFEHWRRWYGEQLALLPREDADRLDGQLWLDESFWPITFELAAGAGLRAAGFEVAYERSHDGLTPDWTVLTAEGDPAMFVEVHTHLHPARPATSSSAHTRPHPTSRKAGPCPET